jgi:hypothetical protein
MAKKRQLPPIAQLFEALDKEKIRFQIVGMSAALLQGVPGSTLDTDLWIDLGERKYLKVLGICKSLGATLISRNIVALTDDSIINFVYRIDGLYSFETEWKKAICITLFRKKVRVLPLRRILKSKQYIQRPKDLIHIPLIKQALKLKSILRT